MSIDKDPMPTLAIDEATIPVRFKGEKFMWLKQCDGSGAVAYCRHIDDDGHVIFDHVFSDSYAHVTADGKIVRYGAVIGNRDDLKILPH